MSKFTTNDNCPEGRLGHSETTGPTSDLSTKSFVDPLQAPAAEVAPKTAVSIAKKWGIAGTQEMGRIFPDTGASITITQVSSKRQVA